MCEGLLSDTLPHLLLEELKPANDGQYECPHCSRHFKDRSNMKKHEWICKKAPQTELEQLKATVNDLLEKHKDIVCRVEQPTSNNYHNCNMSTNIQNNIHLHSFGHETLDHLPISFLNWCFANKGEGIKTLIQDIHFDKECPENHNVRLKSTKRELMEVYSNGQWVVTDQDRVLTDLIEKGYRVLRSHGRRNKDGVMDDEDLEETDFNEIMEWLEKVYEDSKEQKPIKRDLLLLFLNKKPMLLERGC